VASLPHIIVSGTDTGIGKTVFAAGLAHFLNASYWKPVQAGLEPETDTETVRRLAQLPPQRILPERWRLKLAASPHLAAEREGVDIDPDSLLLPALAGTLVVEGAGGLAVPLTRARCYIDVFASWRAPLVLCARTSLGTLNHTLLSVEALRARSIPVLGIALLGDPHEDNARTLAELSGVPILGRLPRLAPLTPAALQQAFAAAFRRESFLSPEA
jgi:dethiobiotin synthetase